MRVEILSFAKTCEESLVDAECEYLRRLRGELRVELKALSSGKSGRQTEAQLRAAEAAALFATLKSASVLIALDEAGIEMTSPQFAELLGKHMNQGTQTLCFAVAGPFGWADEVKQRAGMLLSLGRMTFPAHVARFLLVEQLYRALCIIKGHPYHK